MLSFMGNPRWRRGVWALLGGLLLALWLPQTALAHGGADSGRQFPGLSGAFLWTAVSLTGWVYVRRVRQVWQRLGRGRGVAEWRLWTFLGGLLALLIALASPLERWSEQIFAAHMVQHVLLLLVAAPLLVLGLSPAAAAWLAPKPWRRPLAQALHRVFDVTGAGFTWPLLVWLVYALTLWIWHVPALYEAALVNDWIHTVEHACFLGTAFLFWWTLAYSPGGRHTAVGLLFIFTTALHSGLLGVLLTFSRTAWYPAYAEGPRAWNMTALADQQLGGAIMWVVAGFIYLFALLALLFAWFRLAERRDAWAT